MRERKPAVADSSSRAGVECLYDTEFAGLTRYAHSVTGDRSTAEDLVQEAFIILLDTPPDDTALVQSVGGAPDLIEFSAYNARSEL